MWRLHHAAKDQLAKDQLAKDKLVEDQLAKDQGAAKDQHAMKEQIAAKDQPAAKGHHAKDQAAAAHPPLESPHRKVQRSLVLGLLERVKEQPEMPWAAMAWPYLSQGAEVTLPPPKMMRPTRHRQGGAQLLAAWAQDCWYTGSAPC